MHRILAAIVAVFLFVHTGFVGAQSSTSVLSGRVLDQSASLGFEGARVSIPALNREVATARDGRYRFLELPPGHYAVRVEYLGADSQTQEVDLTAGASASLDFRLGANVALLENVLVIGQAAGQAAALNQEFAADNIKNVISADAIGQFPDQNAAESLQRVSGLSLARDQGEGRFVVIRGIDPSLNTTTINGQRVPAPEDDSRQVNLDVISSDLLEGIEVTKSVTPDMDGDSVGGNVELRSATAFDRGNSLNLRAEGSYNDLREEWSPKLALSGTRLISEQFGVAAALSWFSRDFGSDNVETSDGFDDLETEDGEEFLGLPEVEQRDYTITRERLSAALNFDWRPDYDTDVYWRTLYSDFEDDEVQLTNVYKFDEGSVVTFDDDGASFEGAEVEKQTETRIETQDILTTTLGAEHRLASGFTLDYSAGYAVASEENTDDYGATFVGEGLDVGYDLSDRRKPRLFANAAYDDPAGFELDEAVEGYSKVEEKERTLAIDLRRDDLMFSIPGYWKIGAKLRARSKSANSDETVYDGFGEDYTLADFTPYDVDYPLGAWGPATNRDSLRRFLDANRSVLEVDADDSDISSRGEDYELDEDVYAGYAMLNLDFGKLRLIAGLRVEQTEFDAQGVQVLIDEEGGDGDPTFADLHADKSYTDVLPGLHLRYALSDKTVLRAAYTESLSRPSFFAAAPRAEINIEEDDGEFEREAELGNPELDPLRSSNFDLAWEYYPGKISVLSAGVFYKHIRDFFVLTDIAGQDGPYADFDEALITQNGDTAELYGLELNYVQQLAMLPSPFDGLLFSANATFTDSEASLPMREDKVSLPLQSDLIGNVSLGYEKYGLSLRLSAAYQSEYFEEVNELDDPNYDRYTDEHLQIDFTGSYRFDDHYQVYFNAINLNDEPYYAYFRSARYAAQYEEYGPTYELGIKANF